MIDFDVPTDDVPDDEVDGIELTEAAWVSCPYCGESVELLVDPSVVGAQEYVEDCEVCCRPWAVRVLVDGSGYPTVTVTTLDDG